MRESFAVDAVDGFLLVNGSKVLRAGDGFVLDIIKFYFSFEVLWSNSGLLLKSGGFVF